MKYLIIKIVILFSFFSLSAFSAMSEKINKTLEVPLTNQIEIYNERGSISVEGWDKEKVTVKGKLDTLTEKVIFSLNDNKVILKIMLPDRKESSRSGKGSNLTLFIPKKMKIKFSGIATNLKVSNIDSEQQINLMTGNVNLSGNSKKITINNVSGDVILGDVSGEVTILTVSGKVKVRGSMKKIFVKSVSSNIDVYSKSLLDGQISTVSGNLKLDSRLEKNGKINLKTISGKVSYSVYKNTNAKFHIETGPKGKISNSYNEKKVKRTFIDALKSDFVVGNAEGLIALYTVNGKIYITKKR